VAAIKTARDRARDEITAEIVAEAHRQLATDGSAGLSLRSVARELGMVSSAIYRYFKSRDELLTRLIIESYDSLGEAAEAAAAGPGTPMERWIATAAAIRQWALDHPHDYALLFGTPVPGYAAPDEATVSGTRASLALIGILRAALAAGEIEPVDTEISEQMWDEMARLGAEVGFDGPPSVLLATLAAWSQIFGLVTFELFGQTRGMVGDNAALFDATTRRLARQIGFAR
jgi:AcrR family transcriptional regulator